MPKGLRESYSVSFLRHILVAAVPANFGLCSPSAGFATPLPYSIDSSVTREQTSIPGSSVQPVGSFQHDAATAVFSNFIVTVGTQTYDLTHSANNPRTDPFPTDFNPGGSGALHRPLTPHSSMSLPGCSRPGDANRANGCTSSPADGGMTQ